MEDEIERVRDKWSQTLGFLLMGHFFSFYGKFWRSYLYSDGYINTLYRGWHLLGPYIDSVCVCVWVSSFQVVDST